MKHALWYNLLASCAVSLSFAGQVGYAVPQPPAHHHAIAKISDVIGATSQGTVSK